MYGLPSDSNYDGKYKQSDQHGMNRLPHYLSVTAQQTKDALEELERLAAGDEPFSLHLSLHSPHPPMIVTQKYYDMYIPDDLESPMSLDDDMSNSAYSRNDKLNQEYRNPSSLTRWLANYYGLITEIDDWVGRLLDKLYELGIADNTLLAVTSDHGEMLGAHAMRDKNTFYEESSHVPLLLWGPGFIQPGTIVDDPVSHLDLHSTFLDYLVSVKDYKSDGNTLRDVIDADPGRDPFVVTMRNWTEAGYNYKIRDGSPAFMIRKGPWKLIYAGQTDNKNVDMLFNLDEDPAEMNNLIGLNGNTASDSVVGKAEHLKAMLVRYLKTSQHPATQDVKMRRTWRDMKYWCGDSLVDFSTDRIGTKYLYVGAPVGTSISITVQGDAVGRFGVKLEESLGDLYEDNGVAIFAIRHFGGGPMYEMIGESSAALSIVYGNASSYEEKRVKIAPPAMDSAPTGAGIIASKDFKNQLDFLLSEQQEQEPDGTIVVIEPKAPTYKMTPMPTTMQCLGSSLDPSGKLYAGNFICSPNFWYRFGLARDGDLSLWHRETKIWSAGTCCVGSDTYALLQSGRL